MGLFDAIGSALKSVATKVVNSPVGSALNAVSYSFTHPIQAIESVSNGTFQQKEAAYFSQPILKQTTQTVIATAGYAATIIGTGAVAVSAKAGTIIADAASLGAKLIPATTKGKVIAAVAAPVILGAVIQNPVKSIDVATSAPGKLANVGANLSNLIADPSIENAKNLYKENPLITGAATAAAVVAVGLGTANIISNITNTAAVKANTKATIDAGETGLTTQPFQSQNPIVNITNQIPTAAPAASGPVAVKKVVSKTKTSKKKKKAVSKAKKKKPFKKKSKKKAKKKKK